MRQRLILRTSQSLRQSIRMTQAVKQAIGNRLLHLRLDLISQIVGVIYTPRMDCPECRHSLTLLEVIKGYSSDPSNLETTCPNCGKRFVARLMSGPVELTWYCPNQALYELKGQENLTPAQILKWNPSVYHSALTHFGSMANTFKEMGIDYPHKEQAAWHGKIHEFLGKLPDAIIAEVVSVKPGVITRLRKKFDIPAFRRQKLAEEMS